MIDDYLLAVCPALEDLRWMSGADQANALAYILMKTQQALRELEGDTNPLEAVS
jgi:hypothetical protein